MIKIVELTPAGQEAKKKGLVSVGFGRYADPSNPGKAVAKTVDGKLVFYDGESGGSAKKEPKKSESKKKLSAETIMATKVSGAKGSNPGGIFKGKDGQLRYVKEYSNFNQAKAEHTSNQIYQALGLEAPTSHLFKSGGKNMYASDMVDGKTLDKVPLTKDLAKKILKGFAADVLTANWDAVGLVHDNILVMPDGNVRRIDNGGTLTFRARGGPKPEKLLKQITEFDAFADPNINREYHKIFKAAGLSGPKDMADEVIDQIETIKKTRDELGGWDKFLEGQEELTDEEKKTFAEILDARTDKLIAKAKELKK